jgi:type IV secretory pathway VirB9-like protein
MKRTLSLITLLFIASAIPLLAAPDQSTKSRRPATDKPAKSQPLAPEPADAQRAAKVIAYSARDVAQIKTKVRYTTLIILPKEEVILDYVCGDKDLWVIDGEEHFAYVKPAKEHSQTNLNLITASGNVYSFLLAEVSGAPNSHPDLKVYIELAEPAMVEAASAPRRLVSARELEDYRQQAQIAKEETRHVKEAAADAIDKGISRFVTNVRFAYAFSAGKAPFFVRAMYHDDNFTYIQARPEETPTLYELRDGKPNIVNFDYKNGVYVVDKVLDRGYLVIGKKKLTFTREE